MCSVLREVATLVTNTGNFAFAVVLKGFTRFVMDMELGICDIMAGLVALDTAAI